ncbi:MAG: hypothetical protein IJ658_01830 [Kiritimatiellae bacterium]|nr:hypothetical protein [Kiritimatiellia bacterium]
MARLTKVLVPAAIAAALCGCRTSYQEAAAARQDVMFGSGTIAMERATAMANSTVNKKLGCVELGRLKMLRGDFAGSSAVLGPQLEDLFDETNEGPVLKKGQIAGSILAGTLGDDRAIPYELPAFELLLGLQYQALNSLALGQKDNARVYLRRATAVQEQLKEEYGKNLEDGSQLSAEDEVNAAANRENADAATSQVTAKIAPVADLVRASYENALAWYLMGLFFSREDDASNAAIAYREAGRICPAILPLAAAPAGGQDVIVVYEEDLVDMREPIKIPLPFGGTIWSVDFPVYNAPAYPPSPMAIEVGGVQAATCVPVVNVQALAYRDLKDRIPGIATRNVTRAAVKIAAQQVANHINTGDSYANLALSLGVLLYNTTSTVIAEADTRAWQTVPEHVQLARLALPAGKGSLTVRNARTGRACEVAVPHDGGTKIVWISDARGFATATVLTVGARGTPSWSRIPSLLGLR